MPLYTLACTACDAPEFETLSTYKQAKECTCTVCGGAMQIVPSRSRFRVNGYCEANGYHRPVINYDGSEG